MSCSSAKSQKQIDILRKIMHNLRKGLQIGTTEIIKRRCNSCE